METQLIWERNLLAALILWFLSFKASIYFQYSVENPDIESWDAEKRLNKNKINGDRECFGLIQTSDRVYNSQKKSVTEFKPN